MKDKKQAKLIKKYSTSLAKAQKRGVKMEKKFKDRLEANAKKVAILSTALETAKAGGTPKKAKKKIKAEKPSKKVVKKVVKKAGKLKTTKKVPKKSVAKKVASVAE